MSFDCSTFQYPTVPAYGGTLLEEQRGKIKSVNISELKADLDQAGVPANLYSLDGGLWGDRLCVANEAPLWIVYHSERGQRYEEVVFTTEDEACRQLWTLLTSGRMARFRTDHPAPDEPDARGSA